MLPKAHFTLQTQVSGSGWVIIPSLLSGSLRYFLYSSSLVLPPFLNIFCFCHFHTVSVLYYAHLCMKCSLGSLIFLKRFLVFPNLLLSSIYLHWSLRKAFFFFLISPCYSLELCIQMGVSSFSSFAFASLLFTAICKASSDNFAFLHFFFLRMVLITASCTMSWTSVHSSSGTLSDLIPWIYFSLPLYNHKGFDLGHTWMV